MLIAERDLPLNDTSGSVTIEVRVFRPQTDGTDWSCRYEIEWPSGQRSSAAGGFDSVQALHLALQMIGIDLYMSDYHAAGTLSWGPPGSGYGFPVSRNGRDLLVGDDKRFEG